MASSETKQEKFERVAAPRIENVNKGLELLQNLGRSEYAADPERKREIIEGFINRIVALTLSWSMHDELDRCIYVAVGVEVPTDEEHNKLHTSNDAIELQRRAEGGAEVGHEIAWAIDAIARGEYDLASSREALPARRS